MYTIELDISHEPTHQEVCNFAKEHGCTAFLIQENGPAGGNPLYRFSSDSFDMLQELTDQVFGSGYFDEETIKTMITEI